MQREQLGNEYCNSAGVDVKQPRSDTDTCLHSGLGRRRAHRTRRAACAAAGRRPTAPHHPPPAPQSPVVAELAHHTTQSHSDASPAVPSLTPSDVKRWLRSHPGAAGRRRRLALVARQGTPAARLRRGIRAGPDVVGFARRLSDGGRLGRRGRCGLHRPCLAHHIPAGRHGHLGISCRLQPCHAAVDASTPGIFSVELCPGLCLCQWTLPPGPLYSLRMTHMRMRRKRLLPLADAIAPPDIPRRQRRHVCCAVGLQLQHWSRTLRVPCHVAEN